MNKNDKKRERPKKGLVDPKSIKEFTVYKQTTLMEFLIFKMPNTPRKTIKSLLAHHQVAVGGVMVSQFDFALFPEDVVTVSKNRIRKKAAESNLPIIYEDEDLIVINKPSGLLSVATDREKGKTAYRLVSDYLTAKDSRARAFVVHRLDEDTSGVLVFCKNHETREALQNHWQEVVKTRAYYAIVEGVPEPKEATLKDYLTQNDLHLVYVTKNKTIGKLSTTHYKVMESKGPYSLLDVHISSGRKNQIRVQLGSRGHYVIGDDKYGEPSNPIGRLGLHAYELEFTNPLNGKAYHFKTEMPKEFKSLFFQTRSKTTENNAKKVTNDGKLSRATRAQTKINVGKKRAQRKAFAERRGKR